MDDKVSNFDEFYDKNLSPYLPALKKQENSADSWIMILVFGPFVLIPLLTFAFSNDVFEGYLKIVAVAGLILIFFAIYKYTSTNDSFEEKFKKQIIEQIINFIHPGLIYKPDKFNSSIDYKRSSLYRRYHADYYGGDLIEGLYKNVSFKCSEISATLNARSDGMIFKGLFFAAPLNISFSGGIYIWLKDNIQLPATIADEAYRYIPMPKVMKADCRNGEFEKYYSVYTTDRSEAAEIVTNEFMGNLLNFKKQIDRDISVSFVAGVCYVAIPFKENLFEPDADNLADREAIKKYFFTVLLILSIINQLKLDRF
jgi:hypothetical protein